MRIVLLQTTAPSCVISLDMNPPRWRHPSNKSIEYPVQNPASHKRVGLRSNCKLVFPKLSSSKDCRQMPIVRTSTARTTPAALGNMLSCTLHSTNGKKQERPPLPNPARGTWCERETTFMHWAGNQQLLIDETYTQDLSRSSREWEPNDWDRSGMRELTKILSKPARHQEIARLKLESRSVINFNFGFFTILLLQL